VILITCAKQQVYCILLNNHNNICSFGSNYCNTPQKLCPRTGSESGIGYDLCKSICNQQYHAEIDDIHNINESSNPITMILINHHYCCDNCLNKLKEIGVRNFIFIRSIAWGDDNVFTRRK
jgi:hypothetical protein